MGYIKTLWENRKTRLNADNLNHVEGQFDAAFAEIVERGLRRGARTVFLGDSITRNLNTLDDQSQPLYGEGWATLTSYLSGQQALLVRNAGVTNNTVQDMAARLEADVIDVRPDRCIILAGTNNTNLIDSPTIAQTMTVFEQQIIAPLLAANIEPILCTIPPRSGTRTADPNTFRKTAQWNAFIRSASARYRLPLIDVYAAVVDPATGDYKVGLSGDGVHPGKLGMKAIAQAAASKLSSLYPASPAPLALDQFNPHNIAPNALFLGGLQSTGTYSGLPVGWQGSTTGVTASIADPVPGDGLGAGKWLQVTKTDTTTIKSINWSKLITDLATAGIPVAVGDNIGWGFAYAISGSAAVGASQYVTVALRYVDTAGANVKIVTPINQFEMDGQGVVWFEGIVPANAVRLRMDVSFSLASAQTMKVGQITCLNLTALGLASATVTGG
jgi:lysophospholipase L1-like esterase